MTQQPADNKVYIGETVLFKCKVEISSGWEYHWFKGGETILNHGSDFYIHNAAVMDTGSYTCKATRNKTMYETEKSVERRLHIVGELKESYFVCLCSDINVI